MVLIEKDVCVFGFIDFDNYFYNKRCLIDWLSGVWDEFMIFSGDMVMYLMWYYWFCVRVEIFYI